MAGKTPAPPPPGSDANAPPPASQLSASSRQRDDDLVKGVYAPGRKTLGLELVADPALMANAEWTGASLGEKKKKKAGGSKTAKAKPRKRRSPKPQKKQLTEPVKEKNAGDRGEVAQTMPSKDTQDLTRSKGAESAKKGGVRSFFGRSGRKSPPSNVPEDEANADDDEVIEVGDEIPDEEGSQPGVLEAVVDNVSVTHERVERPVADVSGPLASPALVRDSRAQQAQEKRLQRQELNRQFQEVLRSHHERSSFLCASDRAPLAASGPMPGDSAVSDYFCTPTASSSQIHRSGCTPVMGGLGLSNKTAKDSLDASVERIASTDSPAGVDELQQQSVKGQGMSAPTKGASWASVSSDKTVVPATNICGMDLDPRDIASEFVRSGNWKWIVNSGTKERRLLASGDEDVVQTRKKWKAARKALAAKAAAAEDKASQDVTSFSKPVVEEEWSEKKFEPWDGSADDNFETTFDSREGVVVQSQQPLSDDAWDEKPAAFETTFDSKDNVVVKSHHPQINAAWDEKPETRRELLEPIGNQPSKAVSSDSVSRECNPPSIQRDLQPRELFKEDGSSARTATAAPELCKARDANSATDVSTVEDSPTLDNSTIGSSTLNTLESATLNSHTIGSSTLNSSTIASQKVAGCNVMQSMSEMTSLNNVLDGIASMMEDDFSDGFYSDDSSEPPQRDRRGHCKGSQQYKSRRNDRLRDQRARRRDRLAQAWRAGDGKGRAYSQPADVGPKREYQVRFDPGTWAPDEKNTGSEADDDSFDNVRRLDAETGVDAHERASRVKDRINMFEAKTGGGTISWSVEQKSRDYHV